MSYKAYHDYDDDRDVITCVTLSDAQPGLLCTGDPMAGHTTTRGARWRSATTTGSVWLAENEL